MQIIKIGREIKAAQLEISNLSSFFSDKIYILAFFKFI